MEITSGTAPEQQQGKTFTQEQLNSIVGKRLAEQKQQLEADFGKREMELNKREMSIRAKELLAEKGLDKELADILRYDTEEELKKAIERIECIRGFKAEERPKEKRIYQGYRIDTDGAGGDSTFDPIRDAFNLPKLTE